ncbi:MAG TPA: hypothetical protein DGU45_06095 [Planctomycetes bacterium]|nr:hypothetical protein [Planctomycetota bacterium]
MTFAVLLEVEAQIRYGEPVGKVRSDRIQPKQEIKLRRGLAPSILMCRESSALSAFFVSHSHFLNRLHSSNSLFGFTLRFHC